MSCHMIHYGCYILTLDSCHHVTMITWPNHHWIPYHVTARIELNSTEWLRSTNHVIEIKNRIIDNYDKDLFNWTEAKDRKNIFGAAKSQTQYLAQPKNFFLRNRKNVKTAQNSSKKSFRWKCKLNFSMSRNFDRAPNKIKIDRRRPLEVIFLRKVNHNVVIAPV